MAIKSYDAAPYNDDFNTSSLEGKNYLRILFKPGFSVQVRELNQMQSMLQSQIDKFGKSVYKEGPILDGSTFFTDNTRFIDVSLDNSAADLNPLISLILGNKVRVGSLGTDLDAEIYDYRNLSTVGNQTWRFYIRYSSSGATAVDPTNDAAFAVDDVVKVKSAIDSGETSILGAGDPLGTIVKTGFAGTTTTDVGVFFTRGSFVYNDSIKYTHVEKPNQNFQITGKAVFQVVETTVGATADSTLYDNAIGTPNYAAPGGDRYAITLVPKFLTDQSDLTDIVDNSSVLASITSGSATINYLDLLDVSAGQYVAPARTEYSQLDSKLAVRTSEESGNYTVNPFKVSVREHLNDAAGNGGRYLSDDTAVPGDEAKYITIVEPSVAYVQGYRIPLEETLEIPVDKARTTLDGPVTTFGSANIGNYIEGSAITNVPNFNKPDETYVFNGTGSVTCRIRSIEKVGSVYRAYIYDLSGDIPRNATTLTGDDAEDNNDTFIFALSDTDTSAPTPIFDSANNKNIVPLPYNTISNIEKGGTSPNFESEVVVRAIQTGITPTTGSITLTVSGLTNGKSAGRFFNDSDNSYIVIDESDGSVVAATFSAFGGTNNDEVTLSNAGSNDVTVIAPVKLKLGTGGLTSKSKTEATITDEVVEAGAVATNDSLDLANYDIIKIDSVTTGNGVPIQETDYELDNGQRDGLYKVGKIKYTGSGVTGLKVTYKHYTHTSGDFFDVSSYPGFAGSGYASIPQYKGVYLSDVLDFRPKDDEDEDVFTLDPNSPTKITLNYYLSRLDKLTVNTLGDFSVISGEASNQPDPPKVPADSMALYDLFVPAYTRSAKDIQLGFIDNRRFTMRDIGRLEKRIENLEYYTSLSLLEREANGKQILDTNGERFKNGILVDSFQTQGIADVLDPKLKISFDLQKGELRPQYTLNNNRLRFTGINGQDDAITSGNGNNSTLLSLPFTSTPLVTQDTASIDISVNPYDIATWNGVVELSPASDEWIETEVRPEVVFNINGGLDALANSLNESDALKTMSDSWETHSVGKKIDQSRRRLSKAEKKAAGLNGSRPVQETTRTFETTEIREGIKNEAVVNTVETAIGERVVDISFIPHIRSRRVYFKAQMLKPNTRVYAFFDGIDVSQFCTKATFVKHSENSIVDTSTLNADDPLNTLSVKRVELVTDGQGDLEGFFVIPHNNTFQFTTGDRRFRVTDSDTNYLANTTTFAQTTYTASGLLQSKEAQIISTQQIQIQSTEERVQELRPGVTTTTTLNYYDPLAQSFMIGDIPTGVYSTKIDLYFRTRSENVPLTIHLVTVENGVPTQKIVPFSKVTKKADDGLGNHEVSISENASIATTFEFESPVYLSAGVEYAIVVMSNSPDYRLWMSEVGGNDATTGTRISKNTYMGVSFKSQNASTWTPDQNKDFKMKIHRAQFSGLSGYTYRVDPMLNANGDSIDFSTLRLISQELNFAQTSTSYSLRLGAAEDHVISPEANKYFDEVKSITAAPTTAPDGTNTPTGTEGAVNITLTSTSDYVSPVIDLDRLSLLSIDNIIGPKGDPNDSPVSIDAVEQNGVDTEIAAGHGGATARYITREVELNNAADQLNVIMLANKPSELTDIRVYVRVKSTDERIRDVAFTKVEPQAPLLIDSGNNFGEAEYTFENTEPFTSFQVKVVFTSEDTAFAPRIKDFRAIATI